MTPYALLDLKGLVLHAMYGQDDPDKTTSSNGRPLPTPGFALAMFLERYFFPITQHLRLGEIVAIHDGGNDFRRRLFPGYKDRQVDEEQKVCHDEAVKAVKLFLNYMGVTQAVCPGVEADDVIAYMVERLPSTMVYTVDNDLVVLDCDTDAQSVEPPDQKFCAVLVRGEPKQAFVYEKVEVPSQHITLFKSLVGDKSDTYPGVKGFGPAAWVKLAEAYGDEGLSFIAACMDKGDITPIIDVVKGQPGSHPQLAKILEQVSEWRMSWVLAKLHPELIDSAGPDGFRRLQWAKRVPDAEKLHALLMATSNEQYWEKLEPLMPAQWAVSNDNENTAEELLAAFREQAAASPFVAVDWETSDKLQHPDFKAMVKGGNYVDMIASEITGASFTYGANLENTVYIPVDHTEEDGVKNFPKSVVAEMIAAIPRPVAHNAYFERSVALWDMGQDFVAPIEDTAVLHAYIEEEELHGLKALSLKYLGYKQASYADTIETGKTMSDYTASHVLQYATDDAICTAHLRDLFELVLRLEGTYEGVCEREFGAAPIFSDAHLTGISLDVVEMERLREEDTAEMERNLARLRELLLNQTEEMARQGAAQLYDIRAEEKLAKARIEQWSSDKQMEALTKLAQDAKRDARYVPVSEVAREVDWKWTNLAMSKVSEALGLPPFTKQKKDGSREVEGPFTQKSRSLFLEDLGQGLGDLSADAQAFVRLLGMDLSLLKDPTHPETQALRDFCVRVSGVGGTVKVGTELNLGSSTQMGALLYGILAMPPRLRKFEVSDTRLALGLEDGSVQTDETAIRDAIAVNTVEGDWQREALLCVIGAKKCQTRIQNFYNSWPRWIHPITGRVHPGVNAVGTGTHRPSSSNPNLLNLPKRGEGVKVRRCILPNAALEHDLVVSIDWNQEELRIQAGLSLDTEMCSCYIDGEDIKTMPEWALAMFTAEQLEKFAAGFHRDIHHLTANSIYGRDHRPLTYAEFCEAYDYEGSDPEALTTKKLLKTIRNPKAKETNFGGSYGIGKGKLSRKLLIHPDEAQAMLDAKKALYSGYEQWRDARIKELHDTGVLRTLYGVYRHEYDAMRKSGDVGHIERAGVNFLIQGVASDILKDCMAEMNRQGVLRRNNAAFIAPIYDEMVMSCHHTTAIPLILETHAIMTRWVPGLPIPMVAEPSLGINFGDQIEIGPNPTPELIQAAINKALGTAQQEERRAA